MKTAKAERPKTYTEDSMVHIPRKFIIQHPDVHYRPIDKAHVTALRKSIEANGLDTPITVWNGGSEKGEQIEVDGETRAASFLIAGNNRINALKELYKTNPERYKELFPNGIPCVVKSGELKDFIALQLRENVLRKNPTIEQLLPSIKDLMTNHKMKQKEVARAIGVSEGYVSQILDAEEQLGEEATDELAKEGASVSDLRDAGKKVKEAKKAGKDTEKVKKEVVEKVKAKTQAKKSGIATEKRVGAKALFKRYSALPKLGLGVKVQILENALGYLAGDEESVLPKELAVEVEKKSDEDEE